MQGKTVTGKQMQYLDFTGRIVNWCFLDRTKTKVEFCQNTIYKRTQITTYAVNSGCATRSFTFAYMCNESINPIQSSAPKMCTNHIYSQ